MKIVVYAICKNERPFADRWMASMSEADEVCVLDTGSTDGTPQRLEELGAKVSVQVITPWRFDVARNQSLELVPEDADLCVCTDLDEVFQPGWREKVEAAWAPGVDRLLYRYVWNFLPDGREGMVFWYDKIHRRKGCRWVNPVHEVLQFDGGAPQARYVEGVCLEHHADRSKSRGQYLPLLELAVEEDPNNDRNVHYLGREYFFYRRWEESIAIIDGYTGTLYLEPDGEVRKEYEIRRKADLVEREELLKLKDEKDITLDGHEMGIYANIGSLDDLNSALYYGARGIGLLRSEFQYLGRDSYPGEEELFQAYKKAAQTMGDRLVVIRTADLGADKQASYLEIPEETNPLMGNRGIRFCLDRENLFRTQIRAIYRASWYGNLGMMYPMICSEEEMEDIEKIVSQVKEELTREGIPYKEIKTGIMMETPAAVMIASELARRVDFLGIGTNDLTQYTLAMDRQNPFLRRKYNDHHPAILRMIQMIVKAGHEENCKVCLCGELAADTRLTETFLRMGMDSLSVVPACILPVRKALHNARLTDE